MIDNLRGEKRQIRKQKPPLEKRLAENLTDPERQWQIQYKQKGNRSLENHSHTPKSKYEEMKSIRVHMHTHAHMHMSAHTHTHPGEEIRIITDLLLEIMKDRDNRMTYGF